MNLIEKEFSETLQILSDFKENSRYLVAFSGGTDSLALLALCIKAVGTKNVVPVYVNHNLRSPEELKNEIELNKNNCKKLGVSLIVREIMPGVIVKQSKSIGVEAAARKRRYAILQEELVSNHCNYILTAHHKDDQVETVLMKVIKGSPITGLRGISEKWNNVLRPLLEFTKKDLQDYVSLNNLESSFDSTNKDNNYSRNEIRNEILPQLKIVMPDCEQRLLRLRDFAVKECVDVPEYQDSIRLDELKSYSKTQQAMILYKMWDNVMDSPMPQRLQNRVFESIWGKEISTVSANGGTFYSYNGTLYLVNDSVNSIYDDFCVSFDPQSVKFVLPNNYVIEFVQEGKNTDINIDFSKFVGTPVIRFAKEGESIHLKDGSKTIGKLLQDMKVPSVFRNRVPVIADDEGLCVVFGSSFGGKDRICAKLRSSLALSKYNKYICYKGNN